MKTEFDASEVVFTEQQVMTQKLLKKPIFEKFANLVIAPQAELALAHHTRESVLVTRKNHSQLHKAALELSEKFGIEEPQIFVEVDSAPNAYTFGHHGKSYIVFTSRILEVMDFNEIKFVLGHEMGHIVCGHAVLAKIGVLASGLFYKRALSSNLPLDLVILADRAGVLLIKRWMRFTEYSADRFGYLASGNLKDSERALFKIQLGIAKEIDFDVDEYLNQNELIRERWLYRMSSMYSQTFSTHPTMLKRIVALRLFAKYWDDRTLPKNELDRKVSGLIGGNLSHEVLTHDEAYERLLAQAVVFVARASGGMTKREEKKIQGFIKSYKISTRLKQDLNRYFKDGVPVAEVKFGEELSPLQQEDLVEKMIEVANSDGQYDLDEDEAILSIANNLAIRDEIFKPNRIAALKQYGTAELLAKRLS